MVDSGALERGASERASSPSRKLSPGPGLPAAKVAAHQLARIHEAMVEIVAKRGYGELKVRDIVDCAEVSTRAFYELFASKEDCFLQTYGLISRRATQRIIAAQAEEEDWRKRARLVFAKFVDELEKAPEGAHLALVDAYAAGEEPLRQAWRTERIFEGMLVECFARAPDGVAVPPLLVEGMVAGVARVARNRLLTGRLSELRDSSDELIEWMLCCSDPAAVQLLDLDLRSVWRNTVLESFDSSAFDDEVDPWPSTGDRALVLAAIAGLALENGWRGLTASRICSTAAVSRRKFSAYFDDVEDCYLAALEQRAGEAMAQAARARSAAKSPEGGVYRAIAALCEHIADDAFLARVCLTEDFSDAPDGTRSRLRLTAAVQELFNDASPGTPRPPAVVTQASSGAIWALFHHHIIRDRPRRRQISATLAFLALAPRVGGSAALAAIEAEQSAEPMRALRPARHSTSH
jgi:AcrR family transcriptional regulator